MALLTVTKRYKSGQVLLEADLDAMRESVEVFFNTTGLSDSNVAATSITASDKLVASSVTTVKLSSNSVSTSKIDSAAVTLAKFTDALTAFFCPAGVTMAYAAGSPPTGWLLCDGSAVNRTTYAELFAKIGTAHGTGDGSTTFNLPDYRGRFLRGVDGAAGRDPGASSRTAMNTGGATGNSVGSIQSSEAGSHSHGVADGGHAHSAVKETTGGGSTLFSNIWDDGFLAIPNIPTNSNTGTSYSGPISSATTGITLESTGGETRPINAYVAWIIKT